MGYGLADGISYCMPGGRAVFLDVASDRYLSLAGEAEQSFLRLVRGEVLGAADEERLDELVSADLLERSAESMRPSPCRHPAPQSSMFAEDRRSGVRSPAHALTRIALARIEGRLRPLRSRLEHLRNRKLLGDFQPSAPGALEEISAALRSCALLASPLDRCLPRSIAAAHMMIDRGLCPDLVIGVSLQPFSAHCWVQHGPVLINETLDRVRPYSPILVV